MYKNIPQDRLEKAYNDKLKKYGATPEECWLYRGTLDRQGYGKLTINSTTFGIHRLSKLLADGYLAEDIQVLHECDIPNCFNPKHLFLGTNADNVADKMSKGRFKPSLGTSNGNVWLNEKKVLDIYKHKGIRGIYKSLCIKYTIDNSMVYRIWNKRNWKELTDFYDEFITGV